ncbi:MAG: hypothetical protein JNL42_13365 [Anaerolineae bacterium]|nr:hypothetical protein [Anaerolineae bacterium]
MAARSLADLQKSEIWQTCGVSPGAAAGGGTTPHRREISVVWRAKPPV